MHLRRRTLSLLLLIAVVFGSASSFVFLHWKSTEYIFPGNSEQTAVRLKKLYNAIQFIESNYYRDVNEQNLINEAIKGMVASLGDPYSTYMDKETTDKYQLCLSASYEGIGAEIKSENGRLKVVFPYKGSPAEKAGLRAGDEIRKVNGSSLDGMDLIQALVLLCDRRGTKSELEVTRLGSNTVTHLTLVHDEVPAETVRGEYLNDGIGKIQISSFSGDTAKLFEEELKKLESRGMKGLVVDVRGNPGGYLEAAAEIGNLLVPNKRVILQVEYRNGKKDVYRSKLAAPRYPVVCLIDGGSASAAEILAAALKESGGYPLVGEKSFGKGTVQTIKEFDDGTNLKYTTAKWLTPKGSWIDKKGVEPDYPVTTFQQTNGLPATGVVEGETTLKLMDAIRDKLKTSDPQLDKAVTVLRSMMK